MHFSASRMRVRFTADAHSLRPSTVVELPVECISVHVFYKSSASCGATAAVVDHNAFK